jgi:hypothetical protein
MPNLHERLSLSAKEPTGITRVTHNDAVSWCLEVVAKLDHEVIGAAFAASLRDRELGPRSAFFCHILASRLSLHDHVPLSGEHVTLADRAYCDVCIGLPLSELDLGALESRRLTFRTEFHGPAEYAFVLERQLACGRATLDEVAKDCVAELLTAIDATSPTATVNDLERALSRAFRSNRLERREVIGLLVMADVLSPAKERQHFHPRSDWGNRAMSWRGADGWSLDAARRYFPWVTR